MTLTIPTIENASQQADVKMTQAQKRLGCDLRRDAVCMGTHLLVEMWNSPFSKLADANIIGEVLGRAGKESNGNGNGKEPKTEVRVHQFNPYGVSGQASGPFAHILIHTWPEKDYAAVDIFARDREDAYLALEQLKKDLKPEYVHVLELRRGQLLEMEDT